MLKLLSSWCCELETHNKLERARIASRTFQLESRNEVHHKNVKRGNKLVPVARKTPKRS